MINFRCWYCNRRYTKTEDRIGEQLTCSCERRLRVPARDGGNCRVRSLADWLVEAAVYGGGGALLGFGLAVLLLRWVYVGSAMWLWYEWSLIAGLVLVGFLAGLFGGEAGVNWVGRMIRDHERP
jgi:hypothetical protein